MTGRAKKPTAPRKKANGYKMPAPIATGEVIHDTLMKKKWRVGPSIATGGFGEIYSVCDHESLPKKGSSYPYVMKIEPHENGPLFVEKNFYIRNSNKEDIEKFIKSHKLSSLGMPLYFGHGSHEYKGEKFRYLVLERYGKDLWSIFKECGTFTPTTSFQLGIQLLDVLEYIHARGYVHADIKGANILMGQARGTENQAYLVDFGLAARLNDNEFKPNPKCAHNGTIEYTSRDAHLGVFTKRGDLEILGYNLLHWITGSLPWEKLQQPPAVQSAKEEFMKKCRAVLTKMAVPDALIKFFEYINSLKPKDTPDYNKCRQMLEAYLKTQGKNRNSKIEFTPEKKVKSAKGKTAALIDANSTEEEVEEEPKKPAKKRKDKQKNGDVIKVKAKKNVKESESAISVDKNENDLQNSIEKKVTKKSAKRKSSEPAVLVKVKKTKLAPKATPPAKKNHVNIAIQTSIEQSVIQKNPKINRSSPRKVSFESPVSQVISDMSVNSSGDIFDDSFVIQEKKGKPKKRLIAEKEETVQRVIKKKVTTAATKTKGRSWRDAPTIVNGRSPS